MNPISIEQDHQELKHAIEFQRNSNLQALRLVWANLACAVRIDDLSGSSLDTAASFKPSESKPGEQTLTLAVDFTFRVFREGDRDAQKDVASVQCKFEVDYELRPGYQPAPPEIEAFHKGNAVFNCWPFFREYVQSSFTRMGFPSPPVAFLRMRPKPTPRTAGQPGAVKRSGTRRSSEQSAP
jgi:hypothetical protein